MKLYFHKETGNVYQRGLHVATPGGPADIWAHPMYEGDQLLDLDVDNAEEWTCIDGYGENVMHEGKEISQLDFWKILDAKLLV